jgi:hypothetical protein
MNQPINLSRPDRLARNLFCLTFLGVAVFGLAVLFVHL